MAKIQLNGKKISIESNFTILDLIKRYKLSKKKIAIEYNTNEIRVGSLIFS